MLRDVFRSNICKKKFCGVTVKSRREHPLLLPFFPSFSLPPLLCPLLSILPPGVEERKGGGGEEEEEGGGGGGGGTGSLQGAKLLSSNIRAKKGGWITLLLLLTLFSLSLSLLFLLLTQRVFLSFPLFLLLKSCKKRKRRNLLALTRNKG